MNTLTIDCCSMVTIYDISGKFIAEVKERWDGGDGEGSELKAGVYFLKADCYSVHKVVKIK